MTKKIESKEQVQRHNGNSVQKKDDVALLILEKIGFNKKKLF